VAEIVEKFPVFNKGLLLILTVQQLRNTCFQGTTWGVKKMKKLFLTYVTAAICAELTVVVAVLACQSGLRRARPLALGGNPTITICSGNTTATTLDAK